MSNKLWSNADYRGQVVNIAENFVEEHGDTIVLVVDKEFFEEQQSNLLLPIGWQEEWPTMKCNLKSPMKFWDYFILKLLGYILIGIVASFGAPFWYEALQSVIAVKKITTKSDKK